MNVVKILGKIVLGLLLTILFLLTFLGAVIRFQLLNQDYLLNSLHAHNVYQNISLVTESSFDEQKRKGNIGQEEEESFKDIAKAITPEVAKDFFETNLVRIFAFLNGTNNDVEFYLPSGILPFDVRAMNYKLSTMGQGGNGPGLMIARGIIPKITIGWIVLLVVWLGILFVHYKTSGKKATLIVCTIHGFLVTLLGVLARLIFYSSQRDWLSGNEPSQKLLAMLTPLFYDIFTVWIIVGIGIIILCVILRFFTKRQIVL